MAWDSTAAKLVDEICMGRDPGTENPEFELQFRNAATGSIITGNLTEIQVEIYRLSGGSVPENEAAASAPVCFGTVLV